MAASAFTWGIGMLIRFMLLGGLIVLLALPGCQGAEDRAPQRQVPLQLLQQTSQQQAGKRLFQQHCRECHGTMAEGRTPRAAQLSPSPPDFLSHRYRTLDPAYLFWRIAEGKRVEPFRSRGSAMPSWKAYLSEEQIWQLVAYLRQRAAGD